MFSALPRTAEHRARIGAANKGKTYSAETLAKMSASKKGKPSPLRGRSIGKGRKFSAEHKAKIAAALTGKTRSVETIERMRLSRIGIVSKRNPEQHTDVMCPHCSKIGMKANMTRYHFSNCKTLTSAGV